jgi:L-lactate dehydrogenase
MNMKVGVVGCGFVGSTAAFALVMTHVAAHYAAEFGVPASRVIGSGTTLDTARFRTLVARHFGVDSRHVHGYVIGEHGDSEVLTWSLLTIGGLRLREIEPLRRVTLNGQAKQSIDQQVRRAAYNISAEETAAFQNSAAVIKEATDSLADNL